MATLIQTLQHKLAQDGQTRYTVQTAMQRLQDKIAALSPRDLAVDLLPMFASRTFIEAWLETFHENFRRWVRYYLEAG